MKKLLFIFVLLTPWFTLQAQDNLKDHNLLINIKGNDAWGDHQFFVDINIKGSKAVIDYKYKDSIKFASVRKDTNYQRVYANTVKYKNDDKRNKLAWDTISMLFAKHGSYTTSSKKVNLTKDSAYRYTIEQVVKASKDELSPDINANSKTTGRYIIVADGNSVYLTISTPTNKRSIYFHAPDLGHQSLLSKFLKGTFDKSAKSDAVKKIKKAYLPQ